MATLYLAQQTKLFWETWRAPVIISNISNIIFFKYYKTLFKAIKFSKAESLEIA